jgi:hypothetical protein
MLYDMESFRKFVELSYIFITQLLLLPGGFGKKCFAKTSKCIKCVVMPCSCVGPFPRNGGGIQVLTGPAP